MRITPELELNVAEAVQDPHIGLQGAALLLLCYDLSTEDRLIFASEQELMREFKRQSLEMISRVTEIEVRLTGLTGRRPVEPGRSGAKVA